MKKQLSLFYSLLLGLCFATNVTYGQSQGMPAPGPEHKELKKMEGTWDATIKSGNDESKGKMTCKMDLGGLWLVTEFEGSFGDMKFEGRGLDGYDPMKKKYVSVWVDSMSFRPMELEGTYDEEKKTLTMTGEAVGPDGKPAKHKLVTHMKDNDHHTMTMFVTSPDGEEMETMTVEYTRQK